MNTEHHRHKQEESQCCMFRCAAQVEVHSTLLMMNLRPSLVWFALGNVVVASARHNRVRKACQRIFETAFPPQEWFSTKDLKALGKLVAQTQDNYFSCPEGGGNEILQNYESKQLVDWFKANFNPTDFKFTEYIMGDIAVTGNVCSFDKLFFAEISSSCQMQAMSRLFIEVDKHGNLVKWVDHFDEEEVSAKFRFCSSTNESPSLHAREEGVLDEKDGTSGSLVPGRIASSVKDRCVEIFETAFPLQQWTSDESIEAFSALVATDKPNYFSCPEGSDNALENFDQRDLMSWFKTYFDPDAFKYTEYVLGDVLVAGNTCSFDKIIFAAVGKHCQFQAMSRLIMELDDNGMLVKWVDHFDQEEVQKKFGTCLRAAAIQMVGASIVPLTNHVFARGGVKMKMSNLPFIAVFAGMLLAFGWHNVKKTEHSSSFLLENRPTHSNYGSNNN